MFGLSRIGGSCRTCIIKSCKHKYPSIAVRYASDVENPWKDYEYKRVTYDEVPSPDRPWKEYYGENQRRYNRYLFLGLGALGGTLGYIWYDDPFMTKQIKPNKEWMRNPPPFQTVRVQDGKIIVPDSNQDLQGEADGQDEAKFAAGESKLGQAVPQVDNLPDIPSYAPYLIIGAGTAAFSAFRAIRSQDPTAKILVIGDEEHLPYMRPPLSKEIWFTEKNKAGERQFTKWSGRDRSLYFEHEEFFVSPKLLPFQENGGVAVARKRRVVGLSPSEQKAVLDNGWEVQYDKCLLATGGAPRNLPVLEDLNSDRVTLYRGISDYEKLRNAIDKSKSVVIIGGGFLGTELSCAIKRAYKKQSDKEIVQIFKENGTMAKVLPGYLSNWTTKQIENDGVQVLKNTEIVNAEEIDGKISLQLSDGSEIKADHVVVAIGISPNVDLAKSSGLEVDPEIGGFRANSELQARSNVWVAGDCASFYDIHLGRRRVEHHDHAVVSGRLAGENMTGATKPYWHQSMFWSDIGPNIGYEAIGLIDASLKTFSVFSKATQKDTPAAADAESERREEVEMAASEGSSPTMSLDVKESGGEDKIEDTSADIDEKVDYGKGIIFYLKDKVIVGIVMWNLFNRMPVARKVLRDQRKHEDIAEVAKLFQIHKDEVEY